MQNSQAGEEPTLVRMPLEKGRWMLVVLGLIINLCLFGSCLGPVTVFRSLLLTLDVMFRCDV